MPESEYSTAVNVSHGAGSVDFEIAARVEVLVEIPPGVSEVVRDIEVREP